MRQSNVSFPGVHACSRAVQERALARGIEVSTGFETHARYTAVCEYSGKILIDKALTM
jgi:hypothetical protein